MLADTDQGRHPGRQVNVDAAAKADDAHALAGQNVLVLSDVAHDTARDETGDLNAGQIQPVGGDDAQAVALVVLAGLVQRCVEEAARPIGDSGNHAGTRDAVYVDVEDVHEDANA